MNSILLLASLFLSLHALAKPLAPEDPRVFTTADLKQLSLEVSKSLHKCKQLKKGADVELNLKNATSTSIDEAIVADALTSYLKPAAPGPGKKYEIRATISSQSKEQKKYYKDVYKLTAQVFQGEEKFCEKSEELVKEGKME